MSDELPPSYGTCKNLEEACMRADEARRIGLLGAYPSSCVVLRAALTAQAAEVEALRAALRGMLALDEGHHQRGHDDEDVCQEVIAARAALKEQT